MSRRLIVLTSAFIFAASSVPAQKPETSKAAAAAQKANTQPAAKAEKSKPVVQAGGKSVIWPDQIGDYVRQTAMPATVPADQKLWDEYGFDTAEKATYATGHQKLTTVAYRMKDPTGAYAALESILPANAKPAKFSEHSFSVPEGALVQIGNYILQFSGNPPPVPAVQKLTQTLPKLDQSELPTLKVFLPKTERVSNSERYIIGPESLARVEPRIPPSVAAFHMGAEAQAAKFHDSAGDLTLVVFSYPTPQIARKELPQFQALSGAVAKRSGPLVAVTMAPPSPDAAERVLAQVKYEAAVTWDQNVPNPHKQAADVANLILGICFLAVVLVIASVLFGLAFGGFRVVLDRFGIKHADNGFTSLNLEK